MQPFSGGLTEINVPGELRRRPLYDELVSRRTALAAGQTPVARYFGDRPVLSIAPAGEPDLEPEEIVICDLTDWRGPTAETFTRRRTSRSTPRASQWTLCWAACCGSRTRSPPACK